MHLSNIQDVNEFLATIQACRGDVYLKTQEGDIFNLKSSFSQYIAIGQLISQSGDKLEIFADDMEDWGKIYGLIKNLKKSQE